MTGLIAGLISSWIFSLVAAAARRKRRTGQYEAAAYFGTVALIYTGGAALGCIGIVAFVVIVCISIIALASFVGGTLGALSR